MPADTVVDQSREGLKMHAITTVINHVQENEDDVRKWASKAAIIGGLQKLLDVTSLLKMKSGKSTKTERHTGSSLFRLLSTTKVVSNDRYRYIDVFEQGLEILEPARHASNDADRDGPDEAQEKQNQPRTRSTAELASKSTMTMEDTSVGGNKSPTAEHASRKRSSGLCADVESPTTGRKVSLNGSSDSQSEVKPPTKKARTSPTSGNASKRRPSLSGSSGHKKPASDHHRSDTAYTHLEDPDFANDSSSIDAVAKRRTRNGLSKESIHEELENIHYQITRAMECLIVVTPDSTAATLLSDPKDVLRALYEKAFGSSSFRDHFFELGKIDEVDLLTALAAAWVFTNVLERTSPWRTDMSLLETPGNMWSALAAELGQDNISVQEATNRAALRLLDDTSFQEQLLAENVVKLSESLSTALWPQIVASHMRADLQHGKDGILVWRIHLRDLVKRCLIFRAKLEAMNDMSFEWRWCPGGEHVESTEAKDVLEREGAIQMGMIMMPTCVAGKHGGPVEVVYRARILSRVASSSTGR